MGGSSSISPLAPRTTPRLKPVPGVRLAVAETGMKYRSRPDLLLALLDPGTSVAGVLTQSKTASAPVDWCRRNLGHGHARALLVNAGNANAFTGRAGDRAVRTIASEVATRLGCRQRDVFLASTGVIGEPLPAAPLVAEVAGLTDAVAAGGWRDAARAIMTTDTFAKLATAETRLGGVKVRINGIAKGSGMIAPDMATMLAFIFTDAAVPAPLLKALLERAMAQSFNAITVDGDTSTSDTVLAFATGAAGGAPPSDADDPAVRPFTRALTAVCRDLAHQVVRDGEGARKFVSIEVTGAEDDRAARRIGLAIANSPLVKTAIAGEDANWGRIVMAVGKSGEAANRDRLSIWIGGVKVAVRGAINPEYDERTLIPHMKGSEIDIRVHVGVGRGKSTVWTCDLTHGYISINADYRS
ncbi:MAG: bifunctional glutamate N-acetyltransferase/amino-acid acetyltransferase ArgJ [Hyphomicrobiales bacterium]